MKTIVKFYFLPFVFVLSFSSISKGDEKNNEILPAVPNGAQAVSLFDKPLFMPEPAKNLVDNREAAKQDYEREPNNVDYLIWYGRKLAYAGDYRGAIEVFSKGIAMYPNESRLYRHRGHRYITVREFDRAIIDLEKAVKLIEGKEDSIEPDGAPNPANIPIYTRHSTIWYHLGLAYYFKHDWQKAYAAFKKGKDLKVNNDMEISFSHWIYMTLSRMGRKDEAYASVSNIPDDITVYESEPYLKLISLYKRRVLIDELLDKELTVESSSAFLYGIANWYLYNGETEKAYALLEKIAQFNETIGYGWGAFGFIGAEVDLKAREN